LGCELKIGVVNEECGAFGVGVVVGDGVGVEVVFGGVGVVCTSFL